MFIRPLRNIIVKKVLFLLSLVFSLTGCGKDAPRSSPSDRIGVLIHGRCIDRIYGEVSRNECFSGRHTAGRGFNCDTGFGTISVSASDSWQCQGINGGTSEQCAYINDSSCFGATTVLTKRENGDCYAECLK